MPLPYIPDVYKYLQKIFTEKIAVQEELSFARGKRLWSFYWWLCMPIYMLHPGILLIYVVLLASILITCEPQKVAMLSSIVVRALGKLRVIRHCR